MNFFTKINHLILLIFLSLIFGSVYGQGTQIISITPQIQESKYFVSYDYVTEITDTISEVPSGINIMNYHTCIDPFNGRYFFVGKDPWIATENCKIYTLDISTGIITESQPFQQSEMG